MASRNDQPGIEDLVADLIQRQAKDIENGAPSVLGRPPGAKLLSPDEELRLWEWRDPTVNIYDLKSQGMSDSEISRKLQPARFKMMERAGQSRIEQNNYAKMMERRSEAAAAKRRDVSSQEDPAVVESTARDVTPAPAPPPPTMAMPGAGAAPGPAPLSMAMLQGGQPQ